jgi:AcrR family transcriptional regulator
MSSDTRERILEVASELFIEQGYDGTSLREISDRLGFTKAALYYHFQSKEEILRELLLPFDTLLDELLERLEGAADVDGWADALTWIVDGVFDYLDFFRLVERNRNVVASMRFESKKDDHAEMHARVEAAAHAAASSVSEEVRMVAALGAVTGFDDWAPTLLKTADAAILRQELTACVRDVLGLARPRRKRVAAVAPAL